MRRALFNTSNSRIFTVYGGFFGPFIYPDGLAEAPFVSGAPENFVPNQFWLSAPFQLYPGDWVFQHALQGDGLFQFEDLLCVRDGRLTGEVWHPMPRRF